MKELMNLYNSWSDAVSALPQEDKDALYAELKAAQEKMNTENKGFYQPVASSKNPIPPGAK